MFVLFINVHDLNTKVAFFFVEMSRMCPYFPECHNLFYLSILSAPRTTFVISALFGNQIIFLRILETVLKPQLQKFLYLILAYILLQEIKLDLLKSLEFLASFCVLQYVWTSKVPLLPIHSVPENFKTLKTPINETVTP